MEQKKERGFDGEQSKRFAFIIKKLYRSGLKNVPSTGSGTESSSKYKAVIELVEITGIMSENVPSTGSGTGSSNKYKTVIERSRNHREYE